MYYEIVKATNLVMFDPNNMSKYDKFCLFEGRKWIIESYQREWVNKSPELVNRIKGRKWMSEPLSYTYH